MRRLKPPLCEAFGAANLSGGVLYHDAQFNDARFALAIARAAVDHGAVLLNYVRCVSFVYADAKISGAVVRDMETDETAEVRARVVINATGIFSDATRTLDQPGRPPLLSVSRGSHIVLPARFLGGTTAVMVPKTEDGRVIFAIPWEGVVLVGTTDIAATTSEFEPGYEKDEIDYLLRHIEPYLSQPVERGDILSIFSGLRPLVTGKENSTSKLSREHHLDCARSGLITIAGGKWTTYRRMAEDTLDFAIRRGMLEARQCVTRTIPLRGCPAAGADIAAPSLAEYGSDAAHVLALANDDPRLSEPLDPALPCTGAMVAYAVRHEFARSVDDVLARRTRSLLLDAHAAMRTAAKVAEIMARELHRDSAWMEEQTKSFRQMAHDLYCLPTNGS